MPITNPPGGGLSPVKHFDDSAAIIAGEADFAGQLLTSTDGAALALAGSTNAGGGALGLTMLNSPIFTGEFSPARINQNGPDGISANWLSVGGGSPIDCVMTLRNDSGGASFLGFMRGADAVVPQAFIGMNPVTDGAGDRLQFVVQPPGSGSPTPSVQFLQQQPSSTVRHLRLHCDGSAHTITAYGYDTSGLDVLGPVAWHLTEEGRVAIGTATVDDGCTLTVNGGGNIALHAAQVQLIAPGGPCPVIAGMLQVSLQTSDAVSSIVLRSGADSTEYTSGGGLVASRAGHRFRTGNTPQTRFAISDDAVAVDVPLQLQRCPNASLPSASTFAGCLLVVPDRGATMQLAYSDGTHWLNLTSDDVIA